VANARAVLAGLGGRIRFCYNQGLQRNPVEAGRIAATLAVGPDGSVVWVRLSPSGTLDDAVIRCVKSTLEATRFAKDAARSQSVLSATYQLAISQ